MISGCASIAAVRKLQQDQDDLRSKLDTINLDVSERIGKLDEASKNIERRMAEVLSRSEFLAWRDAMSNRIEATTVGLAQTTNAVTELSREAQEIHNELKAASDKFTHIQTANNTTVRRLSRLEEHINTRLTEANQRTVEVQNKISVAEERLTKLETVRKGDVNLKLDPDSKMPNQSTEDANLPLATSSNVTPAPSIGARIDVITPLDSYLSVNQPIKITLKLLGQAGDITKAPKNIPIQIELLLPSGKVERSAAAIQAGETSAVVEVVPKEPGIIEIRARSSEVLDGGTFVSVRSGHRKGTQSGAMLRSFPFSMWSTFFAPSIALAAENRFIVQLRYSPLWRSVVADGRDFLEISAFVEDRVLDEAIPLRFLVIGAGNLNPSPLVIPKGGDTAKGKLTADAIGKVTLKYLGTSPQFSSSFSINGEKELPVEFASPTRLEVSISPPGITLVDAADVIVRHLDAYRRPVLIQPGTDKQISLDIVEGRGYIESKDLYIKAGNFETKAALRPTWTSQLAVVAYGAGLEPSRPSRLQITFPTILLILAALGGLAGGGIAYVSDRNGGSWRIVTGVISGFCLYWALMFGILPYVHAGIALNPMSAFCLSTMGGWLGTQAFKFILEKLGITI